jgi:hypothetical protein
MTNASSSSTGATAPRGADRAAFARAMEEYHAFAEARSDATLAHVRHSLEAALADYERARNEATLPDYWENLHMARLFPSHPMCCDCAR